MVSMCSPLPASLNAKRGFSHIRFVEEISAKYCLKLGIALKLNVYPIAQHKLPIGIRYTTVDYVLQRSNTQRKLPIGK